MLEFGIIWKLTKKSIPLTFLCFSASGRPFFGELNYENRLWGL